MRDEYATSIRVGYVVADGMGRAGFVGVFLGRTELRFAKQPLPLKKLDVESSVARTVGKRGELPCLWCPGQKKLKPGLVARALQPMSGSGGQ